jgi:hypothetical protein
MKLAALLKKAQQASDGDVLAQFDAAVEKQLKAIQFQKRDDFDDGVQGALHPSSLSYQEFCARQELLRLLESKPPFDIQLSQIAALGTQMHDYLQNHVFGPAGILYGRWVDVASIAQNGEIVDKSEWRIREGFLPEYTMLPGLNVTRWRYLEPMIRDNDGKFDGHCDGFLELDGRLYALEIKTANDRNFKLLNGKPMAPHLVQLWFYAKLGAQAHKPGYQNVEGVVFFYYNKNDSSWKSMLIDKADLTEPSEQQQEQYATYFRHLEEGTLAPPTCSSKVAKAAQKCFACDVCFHEHVEERYAKARSRSV